MKKLNDHRQFWANIINDIVAEFGGSGQHGLTEYYRGGSFVTNSSLNTSIPTSGQISLTDFYGAQAYTTCYTGQYNMGNR